MDFLWTSMDFSRISTHFPWFSKAFLVVYGHPRDLCGFLMFFFSLVASQSASVQEGQHETSLEKTFWVLNQKHSASSLFSFGGKTQKNSAFFHESNSTFFTHFSKIFLSFCLLLPSYSVLYLFDLIC